MIKHFLIYDIKQNKFLLFFLCLYSFILLFLVFTLNQQVVVDTFGGLMFTLLILGSIPSSSIIGANFRSQQTISRKFLLSLPVNRVRLLLVNIVRGVFFQLPLFTIVVILSFFEKIPYQSFRFNYFEFILVVVLVSVWIVLMGFHYSISFEKVSKHQNKILRILKMIWSFIQFFFGSAIIFLLFANEGGYGVSETLFLMPTHLKITILIALILNRFFWTKKLWLNQ
jgi:hypothetical protein